MRRNGDNAGWRVFPAAVFVSLWAMQASYAGAGQAGQVTFGGKILDAAGQPVEGARVRLYQETHGSGPYNQETTLAGDAVVKADGVYTFSVPAEPDRYRYGYLFAEKASLAVGFASGDMRENRTFDITLGKPTSLAGIVVDENGGPMADASVGIYLLKLGKEPQSQGLSIAIASKLLATRSDAEGRFAFANLPAGAAVDLVVKKPGKAMVCTFEAPSSGPHVPRYLTGQADIRIILPAESRIEGSVVQKDTGKPAAGVRLVVTYAGNRRLDGYDTIEPAPDGTFVAAGLPAGEYMLYLLAPGEPLAAWVATPAPVKLEAAKTQAGVKIEAGKGGILEVAVSDAAGNRPLEKTSVSIRDLTYSQWAGGVTNGEGIARMRLAPGRYEVQSAYKPGYTYAGQPQAVAIEEGVVQRLTMVISETPKIRGVVRDPNGTPMAGVKLKILPAGYQEVASDAQGRFEVVWERRGWPEGRAAFCLLARHEERNLAAAVEIDEKTTTLDVKLEPGVLLTGRVTDPNGKGIAGARISAGLFVGNYGSSLSRDEARTDDSGRFEVRAAPAGRKYYLRVSADGYGSKGGELFDTYDAQNGRLDRGTFELPVANLAVSGRVVTVAGRPVPRANLSVYGDGQPGQAQAQTDAEGRFTLPGVCAGPLNIRVEATQAGKRLVARALADGGSADVQIVVREGQSAVVQRVGGKSYEQILATAGKLIAGVAVDEKGSPVAGVPVKVCCHKTLRDGRTSWTYSDFAELSATTDVRGRFAIELQDDGQYNLLFSPDQFAALIVYEVPVGQKDLKVTLPEGGTVVGRLLRIEKGRKVPIPRAEVKIEQTDRTSFSHLGFDRDRTTTTDAEGRFRFEHLSTQMRTDRSQAEFIPRTWQISSGAASRTIAFDQGPLLEDFELLVRPDPAQAARLTGNPLPGFDGIKIDLPAGRLQDQRALVCFFDWQQRPSRNAVTQLARQADSLQAKGVVIAAVDAATSAEAGLQAWVQKSQIPFPVGAIQGDRDEVLFTWSVQSLPWLVLTDRRGTVVAEGFNLDDLERKLEEGQGAQP